MDNTEKKVHEFLCPECKEKIVYDPRDSQSFVSGAARRKIDKEPTYVYLICSKQHRRRYNIADATISKPENT